MITEKTVEKLVTWIKEQVQAARSRGVLIGMSGGIDSAVVAVLCRQACPQNMLGVILPCHSNPQDKEHARLVADRFVIQTSEIVLDETFDGLLQILPACAGSPDAGRMAHANLKPRLRMLSLYYLANQLNYLVAGSSNRCELAIGYFTKYGDSGVDILPLANLVKGQVRELARLLDIPRPIIDKPPSAGLWAGQTDEGEMGFSYDQLDQYLLTGEAPESIKTRIEAMMAASGHKRTLPPIAPL